MKLHKTIISTFVGALFATGLVAGPAFADDHDHGHDRTTLLVTSTNNATATNIVVFRLDTTGATSPSYVTSLPTGGIGGAGGNAGIVQFHGDLGAVANYGSNSVTQLVRDGDVVKVGRTIGLAPGCTWAVSVAIKQDHLFADAANCIESHAWPSGKVAGSTVFLADSSAAQVVTGGTWADSADEGNTLTSPPLAFSLRPLT
jgi:hypothetical protein